MTATSARATAVLAAALAAAMALAGPAAAQESQIERLEERLKQDEAAAESLERKGTALEREIRALQADMVEAARKAQDLEDELSATERRLEDLEARRDSKTAALAAQRDRLIRTLGALQRIARRPPEALIAAPGSPLDTLRGAMLLRVAVPAIEDRAEILGGELAALDALRGDIESQRRHLATAALSLNEERRRLGDLIGQKQALRSATAAEERAARARTRRLAREAADLRELVERLEQEERKRLEREAEAARLAEQETAKDGGQAPENQVARLAEPLEQPGDLRSFPRSPGAVTLVMPARGRLVANFGEPDQGRGGTSKGLSIKTRGQAQVVAPYDGKVAYAGPFRGYGQILIIEHGERYHTLLAGLDRIDAVVGQWVLAGEPVGTMGRNEPADQVLYLELRRAGQPINPLPWFAKTNDKVQG